MGDGVFRRQRVRDGGEELRHLHDRALEAAERLRQRRRIRGALPFEAEQPGTGDPRRDPADIRPDPRIAGGAGGEAVRFAVCRGHQVSRVGKG